MNVVEELKEAMRGLGHQPPILTKNDRINGQPGGKQWIYCVKCGEPAIYEPNETMHGAAIKEQCQKK